MNFRVKAYPGDGNSTTLMYTPKQVINVTLLEAISGGSGVEISQWGVVGSGYNNWGAFADAPFYTTSQANVFVAYVTLVAGEIKFRANNDWGTNFGDNGANGSIEPGGSNIAVTAGTYKITLDLNNNTYTKELFSWGIVGSGYNNWGASPDFTFTPLSNGVWVAEIVPLTVGEIKFRVNQDWAVNLGDNGANGTLEAGGANIAVATAGNYRIVVNTSDSTYQLNRVN